MGNTVVIYESKYGSSENYAKWIAAETGADCFARREWKTQTFDEYDTVVYGGGLYAGGVAGISFLNRHKAELTEKRIAVFTCGIADPKVQKNRELIRKGLKQKLSPVLWNKIQIFHLRGALCYTKMKPVHRIMMAALRRMIEKKENRSDEDEQILATYGKMVTFIDKESIGSIIEWIANE